MNVVRKDIDALNVELTVQVSPEDYKDKVDATLKQYRKTAKIPGFRPGHVPMGMVKKQYGKSVLLDELNKVVGQSLNEYIQKEELVILGNPIPKEGDDVKGDFDNPEIFEFNYEVGLAPEVNIALSKKNKYDYVKVKVDDELIEKQINDLRRRYGKLVSRDEVGELSLIHI